VSTYAELETIWKQYNINHPNAKIDDLFLFKELVALDDWVDIAASIAPYIIEYGPKALKYVYNKFFSDETK
jgi:hypothetical protein